MISRFSVLLPSALLMLGAPVAAQAQASPDGAILFRQRCASCHVASPNAATRLGPDLAGVVGRKAASAPRFNYSPALRNANITWTRANLDRYLAAPTRMVPGSRMVMSVPNPAQRAAILDFLARRPAR